jgi:hypothetical protein
VLGFCGPISYVLCSSIYSDLKCGVGTTFVYGVCPLLCSVLSCNLVWKKVYLITLNYG